MKTGLSQHTGLRQELRVNPRLYQAMDMLYMPMMDLQQHLKQELLANPFLELLEPEEEDTPEEKTAEQEKEKAEKAAAKEKAKEEKAAAKEKAKTEKTAKVDKSKSSSTKSEEAPKK